MKTLPLLAAALLVATNWGFADEPPDLDDPKVREKVLVEAVLRDTLEERGLEWAKLIYAPDNQDPYTGCCQGRPSSGRECRSITI